MMWASAIGVTLFWLHLRWRERRFDRACVRAAERRTLASRSKSVGRMRPWLAAITADALEVRINYPEDEPHRVYVRIRRGRKIGEGWADGLDRALAAAMADSERSV